MNHPPNNTNHDQERSYYTPSEAFEEGYDERSREVGGYVDRYGNTNPDYSHHNSSGAGIETILTEEQRIMESSIRLGIFTNFLADLSFFFGSIMYFWLALSEGKDFLVGGGTNYSTATKSPLETTTTSSESKDSNLDWDLIFSPNHETLESTTDNNSNSEAWFLEDQVLFSVRGGESEVTLYILYGFSAGLLVFASGFFRCLTSQGRLSDYIPCAMICVGAIFAMASSAMVHSDPFWSSVCYSVGMHCFALHSATLLLWASTSPNQSILWARLLGDALFFLATLGGIGLGYLFIFEASDRLPFPYEYLAMGTFGIWCLASLVYLTQTIGVWIASCKRQKRLGEERMQNSSVSLSSGRGCYCSCLRKHSDEEDPSEYGPSSEDHRPKTLPQKGTESTEEEDSKLAEDDGQQQQQHEEASVVSLWTAGPGPNQNEDIAKSSLDNIFGGR